MSQQSFQLRVSMRMVLLKLFNGLLGVFDMLLIVLYRLMDLFLLICKEVQLLQPAVQTDLTILSP